MTNLTAQQEQQVASYIKQGCTREQAVRIVTARPATSTARGNLSSTNKAFSLLK